MQIGKSKAKVYIEKKTGVTFADVEGIDEAEEELVEVVEFLKNPQKYQRLGGRIPKGVLLVGPPGTGKTLLARAVAGEAGVPFFSIYHEAGHAIIAELVPGADPVISKISIIPRGVAALGYTQQLPTEDRYLMTRSELLARIYVLLGGRVAEEMIFGDVSTGAQNDLQKATEIARTMVTQFGMSDRFGFGPLEGQRQPVFLPVGGQSHKE